MLLFQIVVSLVLFAAVCLCTWSLFRFSAAIVPAQFQAVRSSALPARNTLFENPLSGTVLAVALAMTRRFDFPGLRAKMRRDLDASGNPSSYTVDEYLALAAACAAMTMVAIGLTMGLWAGQRIPLVMFLALALGFAAPLWSLRSSAKARMRRISKKLPYTLDLIALMMSAGSTFTEAIEAIIHDDPQDDFNQELRFAIAEMEMGITRAAALENMAQRVPIDTLLSVVGAINQAERLGTPLSTILSVQAQMLRMYRSIRAEKLAASAGLQILLPTLLVLIAALLTLVGPIIIQLVRGDFTMR